MRPSLIQINTRALQHNVNRVRQYAPGKKIIAMVKANAYGCGLTTVLPAIENLVDAFGVACIEEALAIKKLGIERDCILFQGIFSQDELAIIEQYNFQCVIHSQEQLNWLLNTPLTIKIKVWVKINTGMHRLGFDISEVDFVLAQLFACPWVDDEIGLMTHLANADIPHAVENELQLQAFNQITKRYPQLLCSIANSAAIMALPETHADIVRPGIMLYGISPFTDKIGLDLGLQPVMQFTSAITVIHEYPAYARIGYGGKWFSDKPTKIGIVAAGYGDGYPRHISENTPTWVKGNIAPIVGHVSMDMLTIDLTDCPDVQVGDVVELWGKNVPVEQIARSANTIPYELICQVSSRVRKD